MASRTIENVNGISVSKTNRGNHFRPIDFSAGKAETLSYVSGTPSVTMESDGPILNIINETESPGPAPQLPIQQPIQPEQPVQPVAPQQPIQQGLQPVAPQQEQPAPVQQQPIQDLRSVAQAQQHEEVPREATRPASPVSVRSVRVAPPESTLDKMTGAKKENSSSWGQWLKIGLALGVGVIIGNQFLPQQSVEIEGPYFASVVRY